MLRVNHWVAPVALLLAFTAAVHAADRSVAQALDWLTGHWCGGTAARQMEEHWLPPAGAEALGVSRTVVDGRMVDFEFLRIAQHEGELAYIAQPRGRPPTVFRWTAGGDAWARFENPAHDFPTRIEYRRTGDRLRAEIAGPDGKGGEQRMGFEFQSCPAETHNTTD